MAPVVLPNLVLPPYALFRTLIRIRVPVDLWVSETLDGSEVYDRRERHLERIRSRLYLRLGWFQHEKLLIDNHHIDSHYLPHNVYDPNRISFQLATRGCSHCDCFSTLASHQENHLKVVGD